MVKTIIFNLDGPLLRTDILKVDSFALAVVELSQDQITVKEVREHLGQQIHLSRYGLIQNLIQTFELKDIALSKMDRYNVSTPWQAFSQLRKELYQTMLLDPLVILKNYCPYSLDLVIWAHQNDFKTALTSGFDHAETLRILRLLDIQFEFDFITSRDDVKNRKPDPEMLILTADQLESEYKDCVVIEDSCYGIQAAQFADMECICILNYFNRNIIRESKFLDKSRVIESGIHMKDKFQSLLKEI